tara:strand:- start:758 stop:964 length:207 start_codon:yes stop_codon:yes gene_type:complete
MKVGDLLVQKSNGKEHVGLIVKIKAGSSGWPNAFIEWTAESPNDYWYEHGYSCVNISNQHHIFTVIEA